MRRTLARIEDVCDLRNVAWAFWRASRAARDSAEHREFTRDLAGNLRAVAERLRDGTGSWTFRHFKIRDPKPRIIHAPRFADRVAHHALMRVLEPIFERAHHPDTYACRPKRGALVAVRRVQALSGRFPYFVKIDIRSYFASIDHSRLLASIARRIRGDAVLRVCRGIIRAFETTPGRGLPIGSLTSQHFANHYLGVFDRWLAADPRVGGLVRYMDDTVWWVRDRETARATLVAARGFLAEELGLEVKDGVQLQHSCSGINFCGFRVYPTTLRLSRRRQRRYAAARRRAENAYSAGQLTSLELQRAVDAALAITAHADALGWRRGQLSRVPPPEALR